MAPGPSSGPATRIRRGRSRVDRQETPMTATIPQEPRKLGPWSRKTWIVLAGLACVVVAVVLVLFLGGGGTTPTY